MFLLNMQTKLFELAYDNNKPYHKQDLMFESPDWLILLLTMIYSQSASRSQIRFY